MSKELFWKDDEDKAYMTFEYRCLGKTVRIDNEYPYDVQWSEVLDDVIRSLESQYGYAFDLSDHDLGTYYQGKSNGE
jgi:hypothetical protein